MVNKDLTVINILIFYDEPGWAWWHRAHNIKRHTSSNLSIDILKISEPFDYESYDFVLLFEAYLYQQIFHVPQHKVILGSSTLKSLTGAIETYRAGCFAGFVVNNLEAFRLVCHLPNVFCCENGVDEELFYFKYPRSNEITACWVGNNRSMNNKGIDIIKDACDYAAVKLLLVEQSENIYKGNLLTQEQVRDDVYHNASFYICASEMEGTPNPALESLACGLPVISTRVGNMPEVIVDDYNGYLVERSAEAIAGAIEKLKRADLMKISRNARQSIMNGWTWRQQVTKYEHMFHELINQENARSKISLEVSAKYPPNDVPVSFCIITAGKRNDLLDIVIASIQAQNIPHYEILITGRYRARPRVTYIPCEDAADSGRLGEMRNAAVHKARHENLVILDDDIVLSTNWYQAFISYPEPFQILTSQVRLPDGTRYWDHATYGGPRGHIILEADELDEHVYMTGGGGWVIKKSIAEQVLWDSQRGFYQGEDSDFSARCRLKGCRISHHHQMVVYHADPTYTCVGRVVSRRKKQRGPDWLLHEIANLTPSYLHTQAQIFIDNGEIAEAADCLRYAVDHLTVCYDTQVLLQSLETRYFGPLSDARWSCPLDPQYKQDMTLYATRIPSFSTGDYMDTHQQHEFIPKGIMLHVERVEEKFVFIDSCIVPCEATQKSALELARFLVNLPHFHLHFGGTGDALLLLATMPIETQECTVVSIANSTMAMKAFFAAFPAVKTVYFIPHPESVTSIPDREKSPVHFLLRNVIPLLPNCLGRGVTPTDDYNVEWNERLDPINKYNINRNPAWARGFRTEKICSPQVVLAPKGSNMFHYRTKRNIIDPQFWSLLLDFFRAKNITPVVIGTPDENIAYPLDDNCIDRRSHSFAEQMELIASADLLIGADSWHKTFASLAGIQSIVFQPITGEDLKDWKDSSEYVFVDPWENIALVRNMEDLTTAYTEFEQSGHISERRLTPPQSRMTRRFLSSFSPCFWERDYAAASNVMFRCTPAIGDALYLTAIVAELKRQHPHLLIYISGNETTEMVFRHHPAVADFVAIHSNEELGLEATIDITVEYNHIIDCLPEYRNSLGFFDIMANIGGIHLNDRKMIYTIKAEEALWAEQELVRFAAGAPMVGLQFHTSKDAKRSYPHGKELVDRLRKNYPHVRFILLGLEPLGEDSPDIYDCANRKTPLRNQMALARLCTAFITIDSAFFHVGHNLFSKPTLLIIGPTNPRLIGVPEFGTFMPVVNTSLQCLACYWSKECNGECMHNLAPDIIAAAFEVLVAAAVTVCREWQQPLPERVITATHEQPYDLQLVSCLMKPGGPFMLSIDAASPGLPEYAREWNGVHIVRRNDAEASEPEKNQSHEPVYESISCLYCNSTEIKPFRKVADIVECLSCGTVYLRTRMTQESMYQLYQSYADGESHMALPATMEAAKLSGLRREHIMQEILSFVSPQGTLLDIGCGWGAFLDNARDKGFTPRGIEMTRKCVAYANDVLGIHVTNDQFLNTPFADNSLAVITMNHVLEHLPRPKESIEKIFRILEPGGMFCGIVPNIDSVCSHCEGDAWEWLDPFYHYVHYSPKTIKKHLEEAGFTIERIYTALDDYRLTAVQNYIGIAKGTSDIKEIEMQRKSLEEAGYGEAIRFFARKSLG